MVVWYHGFPSQKRVLNVVADRKFSIISSFFLSI